MKRRLIISALLLICLSLLGFGTIAYFSTNDTATNVVTMGNLDIKLTETAISEDGTEVPFEDVVGVMPGMTVSKIACVDNIGGQPAYVRVQLQKEILLAEGTQGNADLGLVGLDINVRDWTEKDGYYYYNKPLLPGEKTQPLFENVIFSSDMSNMYQNSDAKITVKVGATQVANNGDSALEAAGWPEVE